MSGISGSPTSLGLFWARSKNFSSYLEVDLNLNLLCLAPKASFPFFLPQILFYWKSHKIWILNNHQICLIRHWLNDRSKLPNWRRFVKFLSLAVSVALSLTLSHVYLSALLSLSKVSSCFFFFYWRSLSVINQFYCCKLLIFFFFRVRCELICIGRYIGFFAIHSISIQTLFISSIILFVYHA